MAIAIRLIDYALGFVVVVCPALIIAWYVGQRRGRD